MIKKMRRKIDRAHGLWFNAAHYRAVSSAVEHCLHTAGVTGSIPVPPTRINYGLHFMCFRQMRLTPTSSNRFSAASMSGVVLRFKDKDA